MDKEAIIEYLILVPLMLFFVIGVLGGRHGWFWQLFAWMVGVEVAP